MAQQTEQVRCPSMHFRKCSQKQQQQKTALFRFVAHNNDHATVSPPKIHQRFDRHGRRSLGAIRKIYTSQLQPKRERERKEEKERKKRKKRERKVKERNEREREREVKERKTERRGKRKRKVPVCPKEIVCEFCDFIYIYQRRSLAIFYRV